MDRDKKEGKKPIEVGPEFEEMLQQLAARSSRSKVMKTRTNAISGERANPRPGLRRGFQPQQ